MLDGIIMEKLGIPSAVICTELFISSGKAMALAHGYANYQFAIIPHPINITPTDLLDKWAEEVTHTVESLLTSPK